MNLRKIRSDKKVTQEKLAEFLNTTQNTISNYENGISEPSIETIIKLADYFNVSVDYLLGHPYNNQIGYVPEDRRETLALLTQINDKHFDLVCAYVKALIDSNK